MMQNYKAEFNESEMVSEIDLDPFLAKLFVFCAVTYKC